MAVLFLALAALGACDVAPKARLSADPVNSGGNGTTLDPTLDVNIAGYFYAGRPVEGLIYSCSVAGRAPTTASTDHDGMFVCPRTATVSFFIGVAGATNLKLGQVVLEIFGKGNDTDKRNYMAVTPATLYGTATDADRPEVTNIYNLLTSLDTHIARPAWHQPTIVLTGDTHAALVRSATFPSLVMNMTPTTFASTLATVVGEVGADPLVDLVLATARPDAPVLSPAEAEKLANDSILRARTGLYRTSSFVFASSATQGYLVNSSVLVGNNGAASGFAEGEIFANSGQSLTIDMSTLAASAAVLPDGTLDGFSFLSGYTGQTLSFTGALLNDSVYGEERICNPSAPNWRIPEAYCDALPVNDGFTADDYGVFSSSMGLTGDLYLARVAETLPDIDLDLLPVEYLPRTFEMTLGRYSDIQRTEFFSAAYAGVSADKTVLGAVTELPDKVRYTIMPNGDVVSDVDADCADVTLVDGRYMDDDREEYLIGRVANIFQDHNKSYMTLQLVVLNAGHPDFGLTIGFTALKRATFPMVMKVATGELLSKSCNPGAASCPDKIEWFNDVDFINDVYRPDVANGDDTAADNALYHDNAYYGQVMGNAPVLGTTAICPASLPAP